MSLQVILSVDVEPMFQAIPDPPSIPPAPPLPANLQFRPFYSDLKHKAAADLQLHGDSDKDSGHGGSMLFILPGLELSDDEFSDNDADLLVPVLPTKLTPEKMQPEQM